MSPVVLHLILWAPFILTVVISGILFCRSGYRKGIWRALIALGAILTAALLSILLAGLLSYLIAPAIAGAIPANALSPDPLTGHVIAALAGVAIRSALSMVLYGLFMLIFTIVLRSVSAKVQPDKLITTEKPMRWLGLGVGLLSAVIFTLLWLSPLYGTFAAFSPVAANIMAIREAPGVPNQTRVLLQDAQRHPIVAISGSAPMKLVYNGVAATGVGSVSLPMADMADAAEEATALVSIVAHTDDAAVITENSRQLAALLRGKVTNQKWFHALTVAMAKEATAGAAQISGGKGVFIKQLAEAFDLSQDVFSQNLDALLNCCDYALDKDIVQIVQSEDWDRLYTSGILAQIGKTVNSSSEAVKLKGLLVTAATASSIFNDDFDAAIALSKAYPATTVTDPQLQLREAETIVQYMFMSASPAEFILRYPAMGEPAMEKLISQADLMAFSGLHPQTQDTIRALIAGKPEYSTDLYDHALYCAQAPLGSTNFAASCHLLVAIRNFSKLGILSYYEEYEPSSLRFALDTIGVNAFTLLPGGKKIFVIMDQLPEMLEADPSLSKYDLPSGINGVFKLIFAAEEHTILSDPRGQNTIEPDICLQMYTNNRLMVEAVKQYALNHKEDPLQIAGKLSAEEIEALRALIDGYYRDNELDPDAMASGSGAAQPPVPDGQLYTTNMTTEEINAYNQYLRESLTYLKQLLGI